MGLVPRGGRSAGNERCCSQDQIFAHELAQRLGEFDGIDFKRGDCDLGGGKSGGLESGR